MDLVLYEGCSGDFVDLPLSRATFISAVAGSTLAAFATVASRAFLVVLVSLTITFTFQVPFYDWLFTFIAAAGRFILRFKSFVLNLVLDFGDFRECLLSEATDEFFVSDPKFVHVFDLNSGGS